ncbi:unnamed protein product, partial [Oppiella nova]
MDAMVDIGEDLLKGPIMSLDQELDQLIDGNTSRLKNEPMDASQQLLDPMVGQEMNSAVNTRSNRNKRCEDNVCDERKEISNLKTKVEKMRNELTVVNRSKNCVKQKNQKITQLKNENEILKNDLLVANKMVDVLLKFRTYVTERTLEETQWQALESEYRSVLDEKSAVDRLNERIKAKNEKQLKFKLRVNSRVNKTKTESVERKSRGSGMSCSWPGCSYEAKRTKLLTEHINAAHTGNRPYSCPMADCNKSFARSTTLDVHIKSSHSSEKLFVCSWEGCQAALKTKLGLKIHLQAHSGDKKFGCSWPGCGYKGLTKQQLENHVRNHTGEKPFVCSWPGCD